MGGIKVSICMVTYNHERYIAQAVESVLAQQTSFPIELVIGEDCSTDNTRNILLGLAQRNPKTIQLRLADQNQGAKENFVGTIAACRGEYVAMLEGDDYWTCPNKLQLQVDALDARRDWAMCFHPTACVYEDGLQGQAQYPLDWSKPEATIEDLFVANFIPTNSVVFRNRLFPGFPSWFSELSLGDWPLHLLNAVHGNIGFLPDIMSAYRLHRGGLWTGGTPLWRLSEIFRMFSAIDHHFSGRYAAAIDRYRLNALNQFMSDLDAIKKKVADIANTMNQSPAGKVCLPIHLDANLDAIAYSWNRLSGDFEDLQQRFVPLLEEDRDYQNGWNDSIFFRTAHVMWRTTRKLQELWRNSKPDPGTAYATEDDPVNKAA
jgi:glycosyltransferase involved in cell wall biosynthesis